MNEPATVSADPIRIQLINPNTSVPMTEKIRATGQLVAGPGVSITAVCPSKGPSSIESHTEEILAAQAVVEAIGEAERASGPSPDAHVIACFGDPGLDAARETTGAPVLGIAEAAMHAATLVGRHFSVVTTLDRTLGRAEDLVLRYGFERACVGLRATEVPVLALEEAEADAVAVITDSALAAVREDRADVIVLGCAGMTDLCQTLAEATGVPVIDGVAASVGMALGLVRMGTRTSRLREYAPPKA
ncbi:aspartate/glutamate racemase family protein [Naumannella halotolerans]|uniref:aspartate/glutamate racemase family protein n=1 Tax=Naumannella halotolerans TaxID=993414 RepID=UPI001FBA3553|nr:aspartate/glutamate racemase family protein [Naumannella halotolerans]